MPTLHEVVTTYCKENQLPEPTRKDFQHTGHIVGAYFRNYWGLRYPSGVEETKFVVNLEGGKPFLVIHYPESFRDKMVERVRDFYKQKAERIANNSKEKEEIATKKAEEVAAGTRKRKRIPVKK